MEQKNYIHFPPQDRCRSRGVLCFTRWFLFALVWSITEASFSLVPSTRRNVSFKSLIGIGRLASFPRSKSNPVKSYQTEIYICVSHKTDYPAATSLVIYHSFSVTWYDFVKSTKHTPRQTWFHGYKFWIARCNLVAGGVGPLVHSPQIRIYCEGSGNRIIFTLCHKLKHILGHEELTFCVLCEKQ